MKTKQFPIYIVLTVLVILTLACGFVRKTGTDEQASEPKASSSAAGGILGEEYRSEGGGFSINKVNGYSFDDTIGIVNISAPGADPDTGPALMIIGGISDAEYSTQEMFDKMKQDSTDMEIAKAKKVKIGGEEGLVADLSGKYNDVAVKGRMAVVMVTPTQQFNMFGVAPEEKWKELAPVFEAVLGSVAFFEPNPEAVAAAEEPAAEVPTAEEVPTEAPPAEVLQPESGIVRQWASSARASSQYGNVDWAASQATGEPDVFDCEDNGNAWAPYNYTTVEWIELSYDTPVVPTEINIYQSFNPSQVVEVRLTAVDGKQYVAWTGEPEEVATCPDLMTITLELEKQIQVDKVRITVDQSVMGWGWDEIDAVELVGYGEGVSQAPAPAQPANPAGNALPPSGDYPYSPDDLDTGTFAYDLSGADQDGSIKGSTLQYQSTSLETVVGLVSPDTHYSLTLFLPLKLKTGKMTLKAYDSSAATQGPGAAIYIGMWLYVADGGEMEITKDPSSGKLSGVFRFSAHNKDDPGKKIEVVGAVNEIPLK
jgi:hypothetical protein